MRLVLLLSLIGPASAGHDAGEAAKLFQAMERKLREAKTVQGSFHLSAMRDGTISMKLKGTLTLAKDNKARVIWKGEIFGREVSSDVSCDGTTLVLAGTGKPADIELAAPKGFADGVAIALARVGVFGGLNTIFTRVKAKKEIKAQDLIQVSDFKLVGREMHGKRKANVVSYRLQAGQESASVKLWIDAETNLPLQRTISEGDRHQTTETYGDLRLGDRIDPAVFRAAKQ